MIKAIIFDCFGVLVGKGFENTYRSAGGDPVRDRSFIEDTLGKANLGMITDEDFRVAMAAKLGLPIGSWQQAVKKAEMPDFELLEYIKILRGNYKTAVLSNANTGSLERKIGQEWLEACFDAVIVSADVGMVKPDPRIYILATECLGVRTEECVFVDDRQIFLEIGQQLGMKTILYESLEQTKVALEKLEVV